MADSLETPYEVVAVDEAAPTRRPWCCNGSGVGGPAPLVRLRANAGHQAAISVGLACARGDFMLS